MPIRPNGIKILRSGNLLLKDEFRVSLSTVLGPVESFMFLSWSDSHSNSDIDDLEDEETGAESPSGDRNRTHQLDTNACIRTQEADRNQSPQPPSSVD